MSRPPLGAGRRLPNATSSRLRVNQIASQDVRWLERDIHAETRRRGAVHSNDAGAGWRLPDLLFERRLEPRRSFQAKHLRVSAPPREPFFRRAGIVGEMFAQRRRDDAFEQRERLHVRAQDGLPNVCRQLHQSENRRTFSALSCKPSARRRRPLAAPDRPERFSSPTWPPPSRSDRTRGSGLQAITPAGLLAQS